MKVLIKKKKLIERANNIILEKGFKSPEAGFNIGPTKQGTDVPDKLAQRVIEATRVAAEARDAAKSAQNAGNNAAADELLDLAERMETWASQAKARLAKAKKQDGPYGSEAADPSKTRAEGEDEQGKPEAEAEGEEGENQPKSEEGGGESEEGSEGENEEPEDGEEGEEGISKPDEQSAHSKEAGEGDGPQSQSNSSPSRGEMGQNDAQGGSEPESETEGENEGEDGSGDEGEQEGNGDPVEQGEMPKGENDGPEGEEAGEAGEDEGSDSDPGEPQGKQQGKQSAGRPDSNSESGTESGEGGAEGEPEAGEDSGSEGEPSEEQDEEHGGGSQGGQSSQGSEQGEGEEEGEGESESEGSEEEEEPIENPFETDPKHARHANATSKENDPSKTKNKTAKDKLEAMKAILKMLKGGEKKGAFDGLSKVLADRANKTESLHEAINAPWMNTNIADLSDDEFDAAMDDALDAINRVHQVKYTDNKEQRVSKIKADNDSKINKAKLDQEDRTNQTTDERNRKAKEDEYKKYSTSSLAGSNAFMDDLERAISTQLKKIIQKKKSWGAINRRHGGDIDSIVKPGQVTRGQQEEEIPVLTLYLDCSSSFDYDDIEKERRFVAPLADYVDEGRLKIEIIYFANTLHDNFAAAAREGGTAAWPHIIKNIQEHNPTNVVIVTDSDMNSAAEYYKQSYTVDGYVWYIWKDYRAEQLPKFLNGWEGTDEYALD